MFFIKRFTLTMDSILIVSLGTYLDEIRHSKVEGSRPMRPPGSATYGRPPWAAQAC